MIIELAGLAGAGKTSIADALVARGAMAVTPRSRFALLLDAFLFECAHPVSALQLATHVLFHAPSGMRYSLYVNAYLGSAAKWTEAKRIDRKGRIAVIDQGFAHLPVALGVLPERLLRLFPKGDRLVLIEAPETVRRARMEERGRTPRNEGGEEAARTWDEQASEALAAALPVYRASYPLVLAIDGTKSAEAGAAEALALPRQRPPRASFAKRALLAFSSLLAVLFPRRGAAVLMYHAVDDSGWRLAISPADFSAQMEHLANHARVVPLADIVAYAKGEKELPKQAVALTFDDGFHDFVTTVLPILERYRFPATLFLTTDLSVRTNALGTQRLSSDGLETLRSHPLVALESHGRTHPHLPQLTEEGVRSEVESSRKELAATGNAPRYFAYPFGDRAPFVEEAVRHAGYEAAFSITEGFVTKNADLMHLPRIQVDTTFTLPMFRARLTGALTVNRALVNLFRHG